MDSDRQSAFSLIEVVVAVGIFVGGIVAVIALLGPLNRSTADVSATDRAAALGSAIQIELERLRDEFAFTSGATRLDQLAAAINAGTASRLVGSLDGSRVVVLGDAGNDPVTGSPPGVPATERFYYIEITQQTAPLNYTAGAGFLAVSIRILWPYETATGSHPEQASVLMLNAALTP